VIGHGWNVKLFSLAVTGTAACRRHVPPASTSTFAFVRGTARTRVCTDTAVIYFFARTVPGRPAGEPSDTASISFSPLLAAGRFPGPQLTNKDDGFTVHTLIKLLISSYD
jgi:hypothetical protein